MDQLFAYIEMPEELSDYLTKSKTTFENLLNELEERVQVKYGPLLIEGAEHRSKDLTTIIIVSAAGLSAVLYSLSTLLDTVFNRPHHYEWDELEELREGNKVKVDDNGHPIWRVRRNHKMLRPPKSKNQHALEFESGVNGLSFRIKSSKE